MYDRVRRWTIDPISVDKLKRYRIPQKYWILDDIKVEETLKDIQIEPDNFYIVNLTKARILYEAADSNLPLHEFYGWTSEHSFNKTTHRPIKGTTVLQKNNSKLLYVVEEKRPKTMNEELFGYQSKGGREYV